MGRFSLSSFAELAPLLPLTMQLCLIYTVVQLNRLRHLQGRTRRRRSGLRTETEEQRVFLMVKEERAESSLTLERRLSMEASAVFSFPLRAPLASFDSSLLGTSSSSSLASLSSLLEGATVLTTTAEVLLPCPGTGGMQLEEAAALPAVGLDQACVVPKGMAALGPSPWPAAGPRMEKRDVQPLATPKLRPRSSTPLPRGSLTGRCLQLERRMMLAVERPRDEDRPGAARSRRQDKKELHAEALLPCPGAGGMQPEEAAALPAVGLDPACVVPKGMAALGPSPWPAAGPRMEKRDVQPLATPKLRPRSSTPPPRGSLTGRCLQLERRMMLAVERPRDEDRPGAARSRRQDKKELHAEALLPCPGAGGMQPEEAAALPAVGLDLACVVPKGMAALGPSPWPAAGPRMEKRDVQPLATPKLRPRSSTPPPRGSLTGRCLQLERRMMLAVERPRDEDRPGAARSRRQDKKELHAEALLPCPGAGGMQPEEAAALPAVGLDPACVVPKGMAALGPSPWPAAGPRMEKRDVQPLATPKLRPRSSTPLPRGSLTGRCLQLERRMMLAVERPRDEDRPGAARSRRQDKKELHAEALLPCPGAGGMQPEEAAALPAVGLDPACVVPKGMAALGPSPWPAAGPRMEKRDVQPLATPKLRPRSSTPLPRGSLTGRCLQLERRMMLAVERPRDEDRPGAARSRRQDKKELHAEALLPCPGAGGMQPEEAAALPAVGLDPACVVPKGMAALGPSPWPAAGPRMEKRDVQPLATPKLRPRSSTPLPRGSLTGRCLQLERRMMLAVERPRDEDRPGAARSRRQDKKELHAEALLPCPGAGGMQPEEAAALPAVGLDPACVVPKGMAALGPSPWPAAGPRMEKRDVQPLATPKLRPRSSTPLPRGSLTGRCLQLERRMMLAVERPRDEDRPGAARSRRQDKKELHAEALLPCPGAGGMQPEEAAALPAVGLDPACVVPKGMAALGPSPWPAAGPRMEKRDVQPLATPKLRPRSSTPLPRGSLTGRCLQLERRMMLAVERPRDEDRPGAARSRRQDKKELHAEALLPCPGAGGMQPEEAAALPAVGLDPACVVPKGMAALGPSPWPAAGPRMEKRDVQPLATPKLRPRSSTPLPRGSLTGRCLQLERRMMLAVERPRDEDRPGAARSRRQDKKELHAEALLPCPGAGGMQPEEAAALPAVGLDPACVVPKGMAALGPSPWPAAGPRMEKRDVQPLATPKLRPRSSTPLPRGSLTGRCLQLERRMMLAVERPRDEDRPGAARSRRQDKKELHAEALLPCPGAGGMQPEEAAALPAVGLDPACVVPKGMAALGPSPWPAAGPRMEKRDVQPLATPKLRPRSSTPLPRGSLTGRCLQLERRMMLAVERPRDEDRPGAARSRRQDKKELHAEALLPCPGAGGMQPEEAAALPAVGLDPACVVPKGMAALGPSPWPAAGPRMEKRDVQPLATPKLRPRSSTPLPRGSLTGRCLQLERRMMLAVERPRDEDRPGAARSRRQDKKELHAEALLPCPGAGGMQPEEAAALPAVGLDPACVVPKGMAALGPSPWPAAGPRMEKRDVQPLATPKLRPRSSTPLPRGSLTGRCLQLERRMMLAVERPRDEDRPGAARSRRQDKKELHAEALLPCPGAGGMQPEEAAALPAVGLDPACVVPKGMAALGPSPWPAAGPRMEKRDVQPLATPKLRPRSSTPLPRGSLTGRCLQLERRMMLAVERPRDEDRPGAARSRRQDKKELHAEALLPCPGAGGMQPEEAAALPAVGLDPACVVPKGMAALGPSPWPAAGPRMEKRDVQPLATPKLRPRSSTPLPRGSLTGRCLQLERRMMLAVERPRDEDRPGAARSRRQDKKELHAEALLPCPGAGGMQPEEAAALPAVGLDPACVVPKGMAALGPSPWPAAGPRMEKRDVQPLATPKLRPRSSTPLPRGSLTGRCLQLERRMMLAVERPRDEDRPGAARSRRQDKKELHAEALLPCPGAGGMQPEEAAALPAVGLDPACVVPKGMAALGPSPWPAAGPRMEKRDVQPLATPKLRPRLSTPLPRGSLTGRCLRWERRMMLAVGRLKDKDRPGAARSRRRDKKELHAASQRQLDRRGRKAPENQRASREQPRGTHPGHPQGIPSPQPGEQSFGQELPSLPAVPIRKAPGKYQTVKKALCFELKVNSKEVRGWQYVKQVCRRRFGEQVHGRRFGEEPQGMRMGRRSSLSPVEYCQCPEEQ
nr:PREDICTED: uncharacterized protein LOC106484797 [Apteryx mantelli mantelli]